MAENEVSSLGGTGGDRVRWACAERDLPRTRGTAGSSFYVREAEEGLPESQPSLGVGDRERDE